MKIFVSAPAKHIKLIWGICHDLFPSLISPNYSPLTTCYLLSLVPTLTSANLPELLLVTNPPS